MTKKKEKAETKKEEAFNLESAIENYECSNMLKKGMITYFTENNIKIKSDKDFEKSVNDYLKLKIGE